MFNNSELLMAQYHQRSAELIAEADQYRLLSAARHARQARRSRGGRGTAADNAEVRGRPAGNLAACGPRAAAPAR
jgi:hypothetical protein